MMDVDDLQLDVEDGWDYSVPPSLESLPLTSGLDLGPDEDDVKDGDEESVISELDTAELNSKPRSLHINTRLNDRAPPPINIQGGTNYSYSAGQGATGMVTTPPKQTTMPQISSVSSSYSSAGLPLVAKSTPADPLTTVTTVKETHQNSSSPSKASFSDTVSIEDSKSDSDSSGHKKLTETILHLQQTISQNSVASKDIKIDSLQSFTTSKEINSIDPTIQNPDTSAVSNDQSSETNSFFSNFKILALSMLPSPSGSKKEFDTIADNPATPIAQFHRRNISTASSSFIPEDGELKVVEGNGDHQPDIISYRRGRRNKSSSMSSVNSTAVKSPQTETASPSTLSSAQSLSYDKHLYIDEFFKNSSYRYATLKRNADFHNIFGSIPVENRLLDDFSCALSREILIQGRVYISENYIAFNSNILGWVTNLVVPFSDVINIEKKLTLGLFNNGIAIETKETKHYFATFITRDATFDFLNTVWEKNEKLASETSSIFKNRRMNLKYKTDGIGLLDYEDPSPEPDEALEPAVDFRNMTMSIDGDTPRRISEADGNEIVAIKPDCGYEIEGSTSHLPTDLDYDATLNGEKVLFTETIRAPPGLVFNILFGQNTEFHKHIMELSDGSEFTEYSQFDQEEDGCPMRQFTYSKALGFSIGPKSTKVKVKEVIVKKDLETSINVLNTTMTPDVPSGSVFSVNTRYVLSWDENNNTKFQLSYFMKWTGKSWIKGVIENQTASGQKDAANLVLKELKSKLAEIVIYPLTTKVTSAIESLETVESTTTLKQKIEEEVDVIEQKVHQIGQEIIARIPPWLGVIILLILGMQFYTISMVRENNSLMRRQVEVGESFLELLSGGKEGSSTHDLELNAKIQEDMEYIRNQLL